MKKMIVISLVALLIILPFSFAVTGDVTGDGQLNMDDIRKVLDIILGIAPGMAEADVTGDGVTDSADLQEILNLYLESEGLTGHILGDPNNDGIINIFDVRLTINMVLGTERDATMINLADMDRNGRINSIDLQRIINRALKIGDVNDDGVVDSNDVSVVTENVLNNVYDYRSDLNNDGNVDAEDVQIAINYSVGDTITG